MHNSLENKVLEFIRLHGIFAGGGGILIAVSGGADSISLLHVLNTLRAQGRLAATLVCGHVNHQLRGQASDADERFVAEQATSLGLPVVAVGVDVLSHAQVHRQSIETAARQLRLAALERMARERGCEWIATGHQKNDNAETVVHRLRRGTGFRGLAGIRTTRRLGEGLSLARPLLCVTRDEIQHYLCERNLSWREDRTNTDTVHTRNFIRHRLLPLLQPEPDGRLVEELSQLAKAAGRLSDRIQHQTEQAWAAMAQAETDRVCIEASQWASLHELIAVELIRRAMTNLGCGERDLTEGHYRTVLQLARQDSTGKAVSLPDGIDARCDYGQIVLSRRESRADRAQIESCTLNLPGVTRFGAYEIQARIFGIHEIDPMKIAGDNGPFCERLDWGPIKPPIHVRPRWPGDRFQPLGLEGIKKVGKFLTAAKIPRNVRDRTIVFSDREKILWVCPVRIAHPTRITSQTQQVLELTVRQV